MIAMINLGPSKEGRFFAVKSVKIHNSPLAKLVKMCIINYWRILATEIPDRGQSP